MRQKLSFQRILGVGVMLAAAALASAASSTFVKSLLGGGQSASSTDAILAKTASEVNRSLPMMVDQFTRLDSTTAAPGKKMVYHFTIVGVGDLPDPDTLIENLRPKTINHYQTSQDMAELRRRDVTLVYAYADEDGREIARFEVSPADFR